MRSLIHAALICAATLGSITVAAAMPVSVQTTTAAASVTGAQVEKTVLIIARKKRVLVARPHRVVKRRMIKRVIPRVIIR